MKAVRILLVQIRQNDERRAGERRLFEEAMGEGVTIQAVELCERAVDDGLLQDVDAILIGGSGYSVFEDVPNGASLYALIKEARARGIPMLGVCFGAQAIAHALGGTVVRGTDAQREVGTFEIRRTPDGAVDAVFADGPAKFKAQCVHQDVITALPEHAVLLAKSERCPTQAFAVAGADIYGVQFHPELTKEVFEARIKESVPSSRGVSYAEAEADALDETPYAHSLIGRFVDRIVRHRSRVMGERTSAP